MQHCYYAVTISPLSAFKKFTAVNKVFENLVKKANGLTHLKVFETATKKVHDKDHIHALVSMRSNIYIKRLLTQGYSTDIRKLVTIGDKNRWVVYIMKHVHPDERCQEGLVQHNSCLAFPFLI